MRDLNFKFLADLIATATGITLTSEKLYLLQARLGALCDQHSLKDLDALSEALQRQRDPRIVDEVIERITTNETSFFRDVEPFAAIEKELLPKLIEGRRSERRLRIWSAASSSGQEAYSIAMILAESFPELESWSVELTASDISNEMVERCRSGSYAKHEVSRGLSAERLNRHFTPNLKGGFTVAPSLSRRVMVQRQNLLDPFPASFQFDLIMLRNVLIYFQQETRDNILRKISKVLRPDGYLMLGTAETPRGAEFVRSDEGGSNVFRRAA